MSIFMNILMWLLICKKYEDGIWVIFLDFNVMIYDLGEWLIKFELVKELHRNIRDKKNI